MAAKSTEPSESLRIELINTSSSLDLLFILLLRLILVEKDDVQGGVGACGLLFVLSLGRICMGVLLLYLSSSILHSLIAS